MTIKTYRVELEDGSTSLFDAENKTDARKMMNDYLTRYCGYTGRNSGPRPKIVNIEQLNRIS